MTLLSSKAEMMDDSYTNLGPNLTFLCSFFPSIAEVCRRMGMNRQQFNKYLNGSAIPSRRNLRRICDFFGVTEGEILQDPSGFSALVSTRKASEPDHILEPVKSALRELLQRSEDMSRYEGYYYRYFPSYAYPGKFVKALGHIGKAGGNYFWKNNETLLPEDGGSSLGFGKWRGILLMYSDRIFMVEYDTANVSTPISSSIFYPCHRSRIDYLVGVQTGMPLRRGRNAAVSRVVLEFIGKEVNVRDCIASCGLFSIGHAAVPDSVLKMLDNPKTPGIFTLEAEEL